jgi:hypothetical protein
MVFKKEIQMQVRTDARAQPPGNSTGKHCHRLGRIEQPVTGIPRFNRKGSKTAKMREEIYRIFAFLCVFAVQVFQSKSQTSMRAGISKTPRSLGGLTHPETV